MSATQGLTEKKDSRAPLNLHVFLGHRGVSGRDRVDNALVCGPDVVPLQTRLGLGWTLGQHVLPERFDGKTASPDTPDRGKSGIVPAFDETLLLDHRLELTLRQEGVDEVNSAGGARCTWISVSLASNISTLESTRYSPVIPDVNLSDAEGFLHPPVLGISVTVFVGTQRMGDAFQGVLGWKEGSE